MALTRRQLLISGAALAAGGVLSSCAGINIVTGLRKKRPNVLMIAIDDLRPQLGCYGRKQMLTPHMDAFAARGMLFRRAYCQVPVCGASRACLMSGLRPTASRFLDFATYVDKDAPGVITMPQHFRAHGYNTVSLGKVYHHQDDDLDAWSEKPWNPNRGAWAGRGYFTDENRRLAAAGDRGVARPFEIADVPDDVTPDGVILHRAKKCLSELKGADDPFFLAVGFHKPHLPFVAPRKYWDLYKHDEIDLADNPFRPKGAPNPAMHNWAELRQYAGINAKGPLDEQFARWLVHGYYACTSFADAMVGELLNALEQSGVADNTIVVLWGDHGWQLGEHGLWSKHCNFETSLHAPLMVRAPGFVPAETNALTEFIDIFPTLSELCGLPIPEHIEGTSFVPLLNMPWREWKTAALSRFGKGDSIRTERYRYTEWNLDNGTTARMLYDHEVDPMENINISELPENEALCARLSSRIRTGWRGELPPEVTF